MEAKIIQDGITFDDVLILPRYSEVLPADVDTSTRLTARITLRIPLVSAPMDTVTESRLAIALAQEGGIGIIHKNLEVDAQAREVRKAKRSENGVITDPITLAPGETIQDARRLMARYNVSGFPVTEDGRGDGRVVGILTTRDMKFLEGDEAKVRDIMTSEPLVTGPAGTTLDEARHILSRGKVEKLLLVDDARRLRGMITMRDIDNLDTYPHACRDPRGRLRVGAAVGVGQIERADALVESEVDVIVVDTAHGHTRNVLETVREIRARHAEVELVAGNVATEDGAKALVEAGVDAVKVGIGPGSICTTRIVTGVGVPQVTAIMNACRVCEPAGIPVIADGGIRSSGDIAKAIVAGASSVMMGSLLGGLDESPGEVVIRRGRRFKSYRGMGSAGAMAAGSADRYGQGGPEHEISDPASESGTRKYVPEGVEGLVPYRGSLGDFVFQMVGGLRAAMGYCGCVSIPGLRDEARFVRVSAATVSESHPHDILITKESPNYSVELHEVR